MVDQCSCIDKATLMIELKVHAVPADEVKKTHTNIRQCEESIRQCQWVEGWSGDWKHNGLHTMGKHCIAT